MLSAAAAARLLPACVETGQSTAPPSPAASPTAAGTRQTTAFNARGEEQTWKGFDQLREAFRGRNPNVDVKINRVAGDYLQKLQLQIASETAPDADFSIASSISRLAARGVYQALDGLLKADGRFSRDAFYPVSLRTGTYRGLLYHLPHEGGSYALYYNKDTFQQEGVPVPDPKKPMTWDEYLEKAQALTRDQAGRHPGETGFDPTQMKTFGAQADSYNFWMWVWQNGGEVFDGSGARFTLDTPAAAEALQFVSDLMNKHYVSPSPRLKQASPVGFFFGNLAMSIDAVWSNVPFRKARFDWDVAPILTRQRHIPIGDYSGLSLLAGGTNKDAAWEWISFCASAAGSAIAARSGRTVPALREVAASTAFLDGCQSKPCDDQVYLDALGSTDVRSAPYHVYFDEMMELYASEMAPVWLGQRVAADGIRDLTPAVQRLLDTGKAD